WVSRSGASSIPWEEGQVPAIAGVRRRSHRRSHVSWLSPPALLRHATDIGALQPFVAPREEEQTRPSTDLMELKPTLRFSGFIRMGIDRGRARRESAYAPLFVAQLVKHSRDANASLNLFR